MTLLVSAVVFWQTGLSDSGPGQLLATAQEAMDAGRYEEAVARFSEVLSSDREDTRAAAGLTTSTRALEAERQRSVDAVSAQVRRRLDAQRPLGDSRAESGPGHTPPTSRLGPARIAGVELLSSESARRAAETPSTLESRPVPPPRATTPVSRLAHTPPAPGPTIQVSLCGDEAACGVVIVRVQPTADILFNGVMIGTAAQGCFGFRPAGTKCAWSPRRINFDAWSALRRARRSASTSTSRTTGCRRVGDDP